LLYAKLVGLRMVVIGQFETFKIRCVCRQ
jgi:hypothetical protein